MKNYKLLLAACAMLLVFGACGNGQNQNVKEDNTETTTAITTPDLVFYDLQGLVKSCDIEGGYHLFTGSRVEFDRSGVITMVDGHNPFAIKEQNNDEAPTDDLEYEFSRDDQGQISSVVFGLTGAEFTWENGRIAPSYTGFHEDLLQKCDREYDAEGHVARQKVYYAVDDGADVIEWEPYMDKEFTYLDFDANGNWTRCKVKYHDYELNLDDEDEITRKIEYFE